MGLLYDTIKPAFDTVKLLKSHLYVRSEKYIYISNGSFFGSSLFYNCHRMEISQNCFALWWWIKYFLQRFSVLLSFPKPFFWGGRTILWHNYTEKIRACTRKINYCKNHCGSKKTLQHSPFKMTVILYRLRLKPNVDL